MAAQSMGVCSPERGEKMKSVPPIAVTQLMKRAALHQQNNGRLSRKQGGKV
jgi:hypothetical protein